MQFSTQTRALSLTVTLGERTCAFSRLVRKLANGAALAHCKALTILLRTHTPAKVIGLAHTARAGAFVWRRGRLGGEMFIEMNKSIERGLNLSRS